VQIRKVALIGGSGFVGRHIARALCARGITVVVPTRYRERAKTELIILPTVELIEADVHDPAVLDEVLAGADAAIHLVGILHESGRDTFARTHVELTRRLIDACARAGVRRLVHMSALKADPAGPSRYLASKGEAEALVRAAGEAGTAVTIFRPSVIFGRGDSFLTLFARMLRLLPVVALGSPNARFQPVWVEDVAYAFAQALDDPETFGKAYDLCGPNVYTLRELVGIVGRATGYERPVIGQNDGLSSLQATCMGLLPVKLLTRDNYLSMKVDSVCDCPFPGVFGRLPAALEAVLPTYLAGRASRDYDGYREKAGR